MNTPVLIICGGVIVGGMFYLLGRPGGLSGRILPSSLLPGTGALADGVVNVNSVNGSVTATNSAGQNIPVPKDRLAQTNYINNWYRFYGYTYGWDPSAVANNIVTYNHNTGDVSLSDLPQSYQDNIASDRITHNSYNNPFNPNYNSLARFNGATTT
jgi:hypothetical protein